LARPRIVRLTLYYCVITAWEMTGGAILASATYVHFGRTAIGRKGG
jgi:hypothetical protein